MRNGFRLNPSVPKSRACTTPCRSTQLFILVNTTFILKGLAGTENVLGNVVSVARVVARIASLLSIEWVFCNTHVEEAMSTQARERPDETPCSARA